MASKHEEILYTYKDNVYLNITNKCPCACTFCIRSQKDAIGTATNLWLNHNPKFEEVKQAIDEFDFSGYNEIIFCGYGEPTNSFDVLLETAKYIKEKLNDKERYQTVYSKHDGSAAAPTAGLHFTNELLDEIEKMGVKLAYLTLHVGLGTFRPVKVDDVTQHKMHSEYYIVPQETADIVNETKKNGGRIICVGTTSCRTVESATENGVLQAKSGETDIFIYPGYKFKITDALITNFHLPKSTLVMLVSALAGKENILNAYKHAVENKYRFFSFGDAMFIN